MPTLVFHVYDELPSEDDPIITVLESRYGGAYEGAEWVAFYEMPEAVRAAWGDDYDCANFFADYTGKIGRGSTAYLAERDLKEQ